MNENTDRKPDVTPDVKYAINDADKPESASPIKGRRGSIELTSVEEPFKTNQIVDKDKVMPSSDYFPGKSKEKSCWDKFMAYLLIIWDGTGFFGLSTAKLGRLEGKPVGFMTSFLAIDWVLVNFTGFIIILVVLIQEVGKYGTQKSQTVDMNVIRKQTYDFSEAIPLIGGHWFYIDEYIPKINSFRGQWQNSPLYRPHTRDIPVDATQWTKEDKEYIQEFGCNRTKITYIE